MVIVVVIVLGFRLDPRMSPPRATRRTPMMPRLACASCAPLGGGYRPDPLRLVKPWSRPAVGYRGERKERTLRG